MLHQIFCSVIGLGFSLHVQEYGKLRSQDTVNVHVTIHLQQQQAGNGERDDVPRYLL